MQYELDLTLPSPGDPNPKNRYGMAKPGLANVPPLALFEIGQVMEVGAEKYGPMNWRTSLVKASVYYDAAMRHLMTWWDGDRVDLESGKSHLAMAAANLCILLDADSDGRCAFLIDDRPVPGFLNEYISDNTLTETANVK